MLNIIAWGGMLFLLELKAAPAMNHPSANADNSPRKIWIEIDSQILNALFCVTAFGLAPWRFRDAFYATMSRWGSRQRGGWGRRATRRLCLANPSWFRPPSWYVTACAEDDEEDPLRPTTTGKHAPPTAFWRLEFVVWLMIANTGFQVLLCFYMWHYGRLNRPGWATGTWIAGGCCVALASGVMTWWEGRKVKAIEGLKVKVVSASEETDEETQVDGTVVVGIDEKAKKEEIV